MKPTGNAILITGGASGIGQALANRLHDAGNKVIIAGRRLGALEAAAEGRENMTVMQLDIADANDIDAFANRIIAENPELNVLINNAGIMRFEAMDSHRDMAGTEATVITNLLGPIRLINALIDHLKARADAAVVNVTSGLAFVPLVAAAAYSATKAAIHSYTISMRAALEGQVEVIEIAPPQVKTGLTPGQEDRDGMPLDEFADEVVAQLLGQPTNREILVQYAVSARQAEAKGKFDEVFQMINGAA